MKHQWLTVFRPPIALLASVLVAAPCVGQSKSPPNDARYAELAGKLDQMLAALAQTQQELADSRKQMQELARQLESLKAETAYAREQASPASAASGAADMQAAVRQLQENTEILQAEVKQHDQTKVESYSKYPIRISGMLLSTSNLNTGAVDNVDLPVVALPVSDSVANGSLATTWRQTVLGLEAHGPTLWGAHSAADIHADFFGEAAGGYETNAGTLRLRTAHTRLDWSHTNLVASLDSPLISPLNPTSYLTVAEPALAWSGNLWTWSPQLQVEHSIPISEQKSVGFEVGLIDPAAISYFNQSLRQANPSEASMQPGYEVRTFYTLGPGDRTLTVAASGYYSRQKYPYGKRVDSWAGTADWNLPFTQRLELSGELYRGRALGSLGGGTFKDYVLYENEHTFRGLDAEGGWTQLKARLSPQIETNAAIGQDSAFASEVREAVPAPTPTIYSNLVANRTVLGNVIFRPRAYLLFSLEYRKIWSWQIAQPTSTSQTVGLAIGYLY